MVPKAHAQTPAEQTEVRVFTRGQAARLKVPGALLAVSGALLMALTAGTTASDGADRYFDRIFLTTGAVALSAGVVLFSFGLRRELARRPVESPNAAPSLELSVVPS